MPATYAPELDETVWLIKTMRALNRREDEDDVPSELTDAQRELVDRELKLMKTRRYAAVLRKPLEDRPRLKLARAIKRKWAGRAGLIYSQIDARRCDPSYELLAMRDERELQPILAGTIPPSAGVRKARLGRGFLQAITMDVSDFIDHGDMLRSRYPIVDLALTGSASNIARLGTCRALAGLFTLRISCPDLGDDGLARLVRSPHVLHLRRLITDCCGLTIRGYEHVCEATRATLPFLEAFASAGDEVDPPHEPPASYDVSTGIMIPQVDRNLPCAGQLLEQKYGYLRFLHWRSRFGAQMEHWPYE